MNRMKTHIIFILILISLLFIKVIHHEGFIGMPGLPGVETPETPDTLTLDKLYIENRSKLLTKIYNLGIKPRGINDINDTKIKWFDDMYPLVNMNLTDKQILILQKGEKELDIIKKQIPEIIATIKDDKDPIKINLLKLSKEAAPLWACIGSICKSVITLDLNKKDKKDAPDSESS